MTMTTTNNFYSCSSASSSAADNAEDAAVPLLLAGAKKLSLSYQYEIETTSSSASSVDEAIIERVQSAMLFNIAQLSGLVDCPTMENSVDEENNSSWRRKLGGGIDSIAELHQQPQQQQQQQWQGLRGLQVESAAAAPPRGRGSNSIVGLSSLPADYALVDVPCHSVAEARSSVSSGSGSFGNDLFSSSTRHVSPGMAGMVAMGEQEEEYANKNDQNNMVVIDGKPVHNVINAISPRSISSHSQQLEEEGEVGAFNYISTQSKPKSASTLHELHNPSVVSHDVLLQPSSQSSLPQSSGSTHILPLARSIDVSNNIGINQNNSDSGRQNKCTVVQGHMSIYTLSPTTTTTTSTSSIDDYSTYENLQGRILYAIASSLHSNKLGIPKNHQDEIRAVRMHSDVPYVINDSTGTGGGGGSIGVSAINSAQSSTTTNDNNNLAFLDNVPMIPIMIGMSILLLAVLALFVSTSRPNKRQRGNNDNNSGSKEETSTIMSAKTIDIDLDAGEEVEYQSHAANSKLRDVVGSSTLNKRTRSGGIGVLAKNIIGRQRSSDGGGVLERGEGDGGVSGVEEGGIPKRVGGSRTEATVVVPNTPKSIRYDSTSLPSPTRRTPMRSMNYATSSSSSTTSPPPVIPSTPQTPKSRVRSVARPRAVSPDVEVELYDCLFPSSPAAASCKSRNSILTNSTSSRQGQVQKRSAAGYLDMLATTFCVNPQYYEDVEVCLKPVDDCTEYVDNEFCSPLPPATPSSTARKNVVPATPTSTTKNNALQAKEMSARRKKKSINSSVDGVPSYVFTEDGGVVTPTKEDRIKQSKVSAVPDHVFAEDGGVGNTTNVDRMTPDSKMRRKKKEVEDSGVVTPTKEDRIKQSKVSAAPDYVFAEDGGVGNTTNVDRMTPDSKMRRKKKEVEEEGCVVFRETFEHKFGATCGGGKRGDGGRPAKRRDRSEVNEIAIEEIRELYSYDDENNRRRSSVRGKDSQAHHVAEASTTDGGSVVAYNPTTACNENWFFSWW